MFNKMNSWQAAALLCLGSYAVSSVAADTTPINMNEAQQEVNQAVEQPHVQTIYPATSYQGVDESIVQEMRKKNRQDNAAQKRSMPSGVGSSTTIQKSVTTEQKTLYPAFSKEEIHAIVEEANRPDVIPEEEQPAENPEQAAKEQFEYIEKTAEKYRHIGPNPVYTYGKDAEGNGSCVGTQEMCENSALMWANFESNVANGQPIVVTEGENQGDLVMPASYSNAGGQPNVTGVNCENVGEGFVYYESAPGYEYPHCGKLDPVTGTYYVVRK